MTTSDFRFGFRVVGPTHNERRLVDHAAAFQAYAECDVRAECERESYLSAFQFAADFTAHLTSTGSTAGFVGPCYSSWLWFDFDSEDDPAHAQADAAALLEWLGENAGVEPAGLLLFFSGSKGVHVGLPTALWNPSPSADFHKVCRRFAENLAEAAAVSIDSGVYDRVRCFRAPNSRHPKTSLFKRRLTPDELAGPLDVILKLAETPAPFDVPCPTGIDDRLAFAWRNAAVHVNEEANARAARRAAGNGCPSLNKATLLFIREGATTGDRHRLLFSAAANLGEFACPPALAVALLEEAALDSGLPPRDVRRQVECGLAAVGGGEPDAALPSPADDPPGVAVADSPPAADVQGKLAALWGSTPAADTCPPATDPQPTQQGEAAAVPWDDPPPYKPLPPQTVAEGRLDTPCKKCGAHDYAEVGIPGGRTRLDCRGCGRFLRWGNWEGGANG
ncbi:MAG: hypothetical protein RBS80_01955 [Thermoguttaceae bacterium]|jgi:hypothetical protein|nr:hypothetical protein [Thermoguttaceae bacterium]